MKDFKFEVGKKYENMKGPYEVLSIEGDGMRICWDTGKEATTTKSLQKRVIERMQLERELREKAELAAKSATKRNAAADRKTFEGLTEKDFSRKVSGTTWRGRKGLGGAVSVRPESAVHDIKSWAVSRKPMIHWADAQHHNLKGLSSQANFFAAIDETALTFGFAIDRTGGAKDTANDWNAFVAWLKDGKNDAWMQETAAEQHLTVFIHRKSASSTIMAEDGRWHQCGRKGREELGSLPNFLEGLPAGTRVELRIAQRIQKEDAIARKDEIAKDIEQLFEALMPLYEASAVF